MLFAELNLRWLAFSVVFVAVGAVGLLAWSVGLVSCYRLWRRGTQPWQQTVLVTLGLASSCATSLVILTLGLRQRTASEAALYVLLVPLVVVGIPWRWYVDRRFPQLTPVPRRSRARRPSEATTGDTRPEGRPLQEWYRRLHQEDADRSRVGGPSTPFELVLVAIYEPIDEGELRRFWNAGEAPQLADALASWPRLRVGTLDAGGAPSGPVARIGELIARRSTGPEHTLPQLDDSLAAELYRARSERPGDRPDDIVPRPDLIAFVVDNFGASLAIDGRAIDHDERPGAGALAAKH